MEQSKKTAITKQKILDAAEAEFAKNGLAATRVDAIAKEAGVNKQLIYAHFGSKEGLYSTILDIVYKRLSHYEDIISNIEFCGIDTIRKVVLEYFNFLVTNPTYVRLLLWENLNNASYMGDIKTSLFSGTENILKKGVEAGVFRKSLDTHQTAMSISMFCFSAFSNIHTVSKLLGRDLSAPEELKKRAEHIADVITKYILYGEE